MKGKMHGAGKIQDRFSSQELQAEGYPHLLASDPTGTGVETHGEGASTRTGGQKRMDPRMGRAQRGLWCGQNVDVLLNFKGIHKICIKTR